MALSPAEKQKQYRDRQKRAAKTFPDEGAEAIKIAPGTFPEFLQGFGDPMANKRNELMFMAETLASVGLDCPDFEADEDPEWTPDWYVENRGSLGRAERTVDALIDAAKQLAALINEYRADRIAKALEILSASDMSVPEQRKQVLAQIVKLEKVKERLQKEVRHSFRVTSVKGDL